MTSLLQLAYFLRMLAMGVIAPVVSLMLMAHGATIETISLLIGVHSVTAVLTEFPSGVLADLFGQKRMFLIATGFSVLCFCLVLISQSLWMLLGAMMLLGLARAFASGTLDALAVNQEQAHDEAALLHITTRFSILESAALAIGALAGGILAGIGDAYIANIAACIGLYGLLFWVALLGIHESRPPCTDGEPMRARIGGQMKQSFAFIRRKGVVRMILVLSVATGFALAAIETYWQPTYTTFNAPAWTLGLISFGSYFFVMLGSKLIARILQRHTRHVPAAFLVQRAVFGVGLIALYFTGSAAPFIVAYLLSYFFLGGSGVAESTLIHQAAADSQRSSILSLFSFVVQIGCVLASVIGYFVSTHLQYRLMWVIAGVLLFTCAAGFLLVPRAQKNRQPE